MKKYILLAYSLLIMVLPCFAKYESTLTKIETKILGVDYSSQSDLPRVERLEKFMYGSISSGSIDSRMSRLSEDLNADLFDKQISPSEDTFAENDSNSYNERVAEDSTVNYPIVNSLESKVFNKEFKNLKIEDRLAQLEKKTYGHVYNEDLSSRVNRLKNSVMPNIARNNYDVNLDENLNLYSYNSNFGKNYFDQNNSYTSADYLYNDMYSAVESENSLISPMNPQKFSTKGYDISTLEKGILKKTYDSEPIDDRLSRLEEKMFGMTFYTDDTELRKERLSSALKAEKSANKYDNNKFSQHMSTAMQIGSFLLMVLAMVL